MQKPAAETGQAFNRTPRIDKLPPGGDLLPRTDKVDCERGAPSKHVQPDFSWSRTMYQRLLALAGFLCFAFSVHRLWPVTFLDNCYYHGRQGEVTLALDDLCLQVDPITSPGYEDLLENLDEEFGTSEFKLKAYESLGGAVRIP